MMKSIVALLSLFASASAFVPTSNFGVARDVSVAAMKTPEFVKPAAAAVAGFMPAILSSTAAVATEGTNEVFGVDDPALLVVLFVGHFLILGLYLSQYGDDLVEDDDFFGEIDYSATNKGKQLGLYTEMTRDIQGGK